MKNLKDVIIYWNPRGEVFEIGSWPAKGDEYMDCRSWGGCNTEVRLEEDVDRLAGALFVQIFHWIHRDGIDIEDIHEVLWGVKEYRYAMAHDMPAPVVYPGNMRGPVYVKPHAKKKAKP